MKKNKVVITSASRTAVGSIGKSLKNVPAYDPHVLLKVFYLNQK